MIPIDAPVEEQLEVVEHRNLALRHHQLERAAHACRDYRARTQTGCVLPVLARLTVGKLGLTGCAGERPAAHRVFTHLFALDEQLLWHKRAQPIGELPRLLVGARIVRHE